MKRMSKCIAYVLAFIVSVNMLFAGAIVAEAQEADGNQTGVTGVSVSSVNGGDIYTNSEIKITVSYAINSGDSVEAVELWFAKEEVDIEDEDIEEGTDVFVYTDYTDNGCIEVSGEASYELGTQVLKRIILSTSEGEIYKYDYVSSGNNEGQLQLYDYGADTTVDTYIDGCTYEVVVAPSYATIDSLSLDTGNVQSNSVAQKSTIYLNVGIVNHTDEEITLPASTERGCRAWYTYTPEGQNWSDGDVFSMKEDLTIPANEKRTARIPMKANVKGKYNIYALEIQDVNYRILRYDLYEYEDTKVFKGVLNDGNSSVFQCIDMTDLPVDFTVVASTGGATEQPKDTQAPQITSIIKETLDPIYTGTPVEFEVAYEDDKSAVEEIWLYFKGENGRSCVGEIFNTEEEGTEEEVTDILGQSGTKTISVYSGSEDRSGIGKYELERIEITDVWGNTRVYSDEYPSGEEVSFDVQSLSEEGEAAILWDSWKKACAFEKVILKNGVRITNAVLKNVSDRNGVKAGAEFAVDVTVQNESDTAYTIGGCQLRWEGPLTDEEYTAETYAYLEKEMTVQPGKSAVLTVPVRLEETEPCGERTLRDLYIYDSENTGDNEIYSEIAEDGTIYNYYRNNRTESTKSMDADFGVHNLQTVISKATASRDGSIVKKCTSCGKGVSSVRIPYPQNISLSATDFTYNGKVQTPAVSVVGRDGKVIGASNYSVSYSGGRKNIGHYAVTVSFGGNYSGSVTKTFNINPKGTKLSSVKAAKKKATVKWKKQTKYTKGYQIQYSTSKNFSSGVKTKNVNGNKKTSLTLKGLKSKKTYYVRIRTFQNVSGGKCYSVWSGIKKVKIK